MLGVYFYAWTAPLPLASPLIGWLCTVGGTELAFVFGGICALTAAAARDARRPALAARHAAPPGRHDGRRRLEARARIFRPGLPDACFAHASAMSSSPKISVSTLIAPSRACSQSSR